MGVDGQPSRGAIAGVVERVGYSRRRCDEAAGGDGGRCSLASDFEGQLPLEDAERLGVAVVNVRAGYSFAGCVSGLGDGHLVPRDENADLAILLVKDRLPVADYGDVALRLA